MPRTIIYLHASAVLAVSIFATSMSTLFAIPVHNKLVVDESYGTQGTAFYTSSCDAQPGSQFIALDGTSYTLRQCNARAFQVIRLSADGTPLATFGGAGEPSLTAPPGWPAVNYPALSVDGLGRVLISMEKSTPRDTPDHRHPWTAVMRLTPVGRLDRQFGKGGYAILRPRKRYLWGTQATRLRVDDHNRPVILRDMGGNGPHYPQAELLRLTRSGQHDRSFGKDGRLVIRASRGNLGRLEPGSVRSYETTDMVIRDSTTYIVLDAQIPAAPHRVGSAAAAVKVGARGHVDRKYGNRGLAVFPGMRPGLASIDTRNRLILLDVPQNDRSYKVERFRPDGDPDTVFSNHTQRHRLGNFDFIESFASDGHNTVIESTHVGSTREIATVVGVTDAGHPWAAIGPHGQASFAYRGDIGGDTTWTSWSITTNDRIYRLRGVYSDPASLQSTRFIVTATPGQL